MPCILNPGGGGVSAAQLAGGSLPAAFTTLSASANEINLGGCVLYVLPWGAGSNQGEFRLYGPGYATSGVRLGFANDVYLERAAANALALRNSTAAQTLLIGRTYTDASNYSQLSIAPASSTIAFTANEAGTGVGTLTGYSFDKGVAITGTLSASGAVTFTGTTDSTGTGTGIFQCAGGGAFAKKIFCGDHVQINTANGYLSCGGNAGGFNEISSGTANFGAWGPLHIGASDLYLASGGTDRWQVQTNTGHLFTVGDNGEDIGASASGRPRTVYVGTSVIAPLIQSTSTVRFKGYTVATLPAGTAGDNAYVTDALAPTFLATVVGGGAIKTPVFYDGTNWIGA